MPQRAFIPAASLLVLQPFPCIGTGQLLDHVMQHCRIYCTGTWHGIAHRTGTSIGQDNPAILKWIEDALQRAGRSHIVLLLSEIFPAKQVSSGAMLSVGRYSPRMKPSWASGKCRYAPSL